MINLDYDNLTIGVEERLNEIFANDLKDHNPQTSEFKVFEKPSLAALKSIIMSLEWEVSDDYLIDLLQEIERLQKAYSKNDNLKKLLRILFHLVSYIRIHKSHTHPYVYKFLFRIYSTLAKIASENNSKHESTKIVLNETKRYLSLKAYLKHQNKNTFRQSLEKANRLDKKLSSSIDTLSKRKLYAITDKRKTYHKDMDYDLKELKEFIFLEIKKLREDLGRLSRLIEKKA